MPHSFTLIVFLRENELFQRGWGVFVTLVEIPKGWGVISSLQKWKIQGGGGVLSEIPSVVGVWIFSGTTHFGFFVSRTWIPGFRSLERFQIPLSCIPDSFEPYSGFQSSASGFYKQKLPRFQVLQATIPESLTWGEK